MCPGRLWEASPLDVRHFEYNQAGECLSWAHWLGPWRQHFDDELRLLQNHRKTQEVGFCIVSILWPKSRRIVPLNRTNRRSVPRHCSHGNSLNTWSERRILWAAVEQTPLTELAANIILKKSIFSASFLTVTSMNTHLRCQPAGRDGRFVPDPQLTRDRKLNRPRAFKITQQVPRGLPLLLLPPL